MFQYRIKVRGTSYLWGGAGLSRAEDSSAILVIRVDEFGELVELGARTHPTGERMFGTLKPGEAFSIPLKGFVGVFARTADPIDSAIDCAIIVP